MHNMMNSSVQIKSKRAIHCGLLMYKQVELSEVYSMTVSCQKRILNIAELLCSHPRAKTATTEVVSNEKQKQRMSDSEQIHLDMESEDHSEYQSAEAGRDSNDDDDGDSEKEQDAGGNDYDIGTSTRAIDETEPTNRHSMGQKTVGKEQSGRTTDGKEAENVGNTSDGKDISDSVYKSNDTPTIIQDDSTGPVRIEHPLDLPHTPRRLRSYSRKRKG